MILSYLGAPSVAIPAPSVGGVASVLASSSAGDDERILDAAVQLEHALGETGLA